MLASRSFIKEEYDFPQLHIKSSCQAELDSDSHYNGLIPFVMRFQNKFGMTLQINLCVKLDIQKEEYSESKKTLTKT